MNQPHKKLFDHHSNGYAKCYSPSEHLAVKLLCSSKEEFQAIHS